MFLYLRQDIKENCVLVFVGRDGNQMIVEEKKKKAVNAGAQSPEETEQSNVVFFSFYFNRGKPADTESMDRPVGEKRYEPIPAVTTPPPAPSVQYTQPQSINSPALSLPAHHKPALSEGEQLGS